MRRKLAAGNWKMNGTAENLEEIRALIAACPSPACDMLICPPATLIAQMAELARGTALQIGAQDCHAEASGAHTGDISAEILVAAGAQHIIVGHSERRADHGESNEDINSKSMAIWRAGATAIICVGETEEERDAGRALEVVASQLKGSLPAAATAANTIVAYEPVWAIGTGRVPSLEDIAEVHDDMRGQLTTLLGAETANGIRILYGGSVKPSNASEIFAVSNVDGGLVGGASLKAKDFSGIVNAAV